MVGMKYLLDTDTCIYIIRNRPPAVAERFRQLPPMAVGISSITVAELEFGIAKSRFPDQNRQALAHFLLPLVVLPFEGEDGPGYGKVRHFLQSRGLPIGSMDLLIAAQALRHDLVLVSNNLREFSRIPDLRLETWAA